MHALTGRGSGVELMYNGLLWLDKPWPVAVGEARYAVVQRGVAWSSRERSPLGPLVACEVLVSTHDG